MGSGKLNIWIRDEDCSLRNVWRADLEIKTCLGEHLIDILAEPDLKKVIACLEERFPECTVTHGSYYGTRTIRIESKQRIINHIPVKVPPGCYVVRVHICGGGNEWSDITMVIVGCGDEACVNLIIKEAETCAKELIIPLLRVADEIRLPKDQVQVAVNVLRKAGRVPINVIENNLNERIELFKAVEVEEAKKIVSQAQSGLKIIKNMRLRKKRQK